MCNRVKQEFKSMYRYNVSTFIYIYNFFTVNRLIITYKIVEIEVHEI